MASETICFLSAVSSCPLPSIPLSWDQSLHLPYSVINSLPEDSSLVAQTLPPQLPCLKLQLWSGPQHHNFNFGLTFRPFFLNLKQEIWNKKQRPQALPIPFSVLAGRTQMWPSLTTCSSTSNSPISYHWKDPKQFTIWKGDTRTHTSAVMSSASKAEKYFIPLLPSLLLIKTFHSHGGISFSRSSALISWVHPTALINWLRFAQFFCHAFEFFHVPWQNGTKLRLPVASQGATYHQLLNHILIPWHPVVLKPHMLLASIPTGSKFFMVIDIYIVLL